MRNVQRTFDDSFDNRDRHVSCARAVGRGCRGSAPALEPGAQPRGVLLLQAYLLSGKLACELECQHWTTVETAKRYISRHCGTTVAEVHLVHRGDVLLDNAQIGVCEVQDSLRDDIDGVVVVQLIYSTSSNVARFLQDAEWSLSASPDDCIDSALHDVVDMARQSAHATSERVRPLDERHMDAVIGRSKRAELVNWMVLAFSAMDFDDNIFHRVVLGLDRYYASQSVPLEIVRMQSVLLGILCTEMKLAGAAEFPPGHWQRVLSHMAHNQVPLSEILEAELEVLNCLGFDVEIPTPLNFVTELGLAPSPECPREARACAVEFATFFLELAVFDPSLQYRRPHVVLAGGALSAAWRVLEVEGIAAEPVCSEARQSILEDLGIYDPEKLQGADLEALLTEEELLELWLRCAESHGGTEWAMFYGSVRDKFLSRKPRLFRGFRSSDLPVYVLRSCREALESL